MFVARGGDSEGDGLCGCIAIDIPYAEHGLVCARGNLLQGISEQAAVVAAEVEGEVAVHRVRIVQIVVNNQFDACRWIRAAHGNTEIVCDVGIQRRTGANNATADKGCAVEIHIHLWGQGVGLAQGGRTIQAEGFVVAVAFNASVLVGGIERDTPDGIAVTNGARDANLEVKLAIADGVAAFVDNIRTVGILDGLVGFVVVVADDGFLAVGNGGCHQSLEIGERLSILILHVAAETGDGGGLQPFGHGHFLHTLPVDTVNHDCLCGISQREGRIAQEHILELIHRAVLRAGCLVAIEQFHLGAAERFAHGYLLASVVCGKEVLGQYKVQLLIIIGIDGARRAYHGDSTASGVEHGHASDVVHQMVVGSHLTRGHNP